MTPELADLSEVAVLKLGPSDALIFRYPRALSEPAEQRIKGTLERWAERTFGRKVAFLILEEGASIEILRESEVTE